MDTLTTGRSSNTQGVRSTNWENIAAELFGSGELGDLTESEALDVVAELVDRDWLSRDNEKCTVTVAELTDDEWRDVLRSAEPAD